MLDIHRHLPLEGELSLPQEWHIWLATSSPSEWKTLQELSHNPLWKHGYGLSPQWLATNSFTNQELEDYITQLSEFLQADPAGYIGEFGIDDRYIEAFPLTQQISLTKRLLHLANEKGRPAVMHHVGSMTNLYDILDAHPVTVPVIIHGFLGSVEVAHELDQRGCYVSFGPRLWMQQTRIGKRMYDIDVPFCLESDFPFIPGKKASPAAYEIMMRNHYKQIAQLLEVEVEILEERLDELASILAHW